MFDFNRSLTLIASPDSLMASIGARIKELLRLERVIILRARTTPGILTKAFSTDPERVDIDGIKLLHEGRLAKWLLINESILVVDRNSRLFNYLEEAEREMLVRLDVRACVPLVALNHLTGVMLLSTADKKWKLGDYDLNLLQMLMDSASIALENAFLYQEQRDRLRGLYRAERLAAVGELAACVAHEIRNPLTGIRSTIQYLLGEFDEESPKCELFNGLIAEVDRIDRTVDGLLSLTRNAELKPELTNIEKFISQTLLLVRGQAAKQRVEIQWLESDSKLCVTGDVSLLKQLFLNLILNALQSMPDGGSLRIDLSLDSNSFGRSGKSGWVHVSLADSGGGIPAEKLDRIFDPFFTTKKGGTGLGLFTSYKIAQQHGAQLEVSSREGEGTTVNIRFPLAK